MAPAFRGGLGGFAIGPGPLARLNIASTLARRVGNDMGATPFPVRLTDLRIEAVLFAIKSFVLAWLLGDSRAAACATKFHSFPLKYKG